MLKIHLGLEESYKMSSEADIHHGRLGITQKLQEQNLNTYNLGLAWLTSLGFSPATLDSAHCIYPKVSITACNSPTDSLTAFF